MTEKRFFDYEKQDRLEAELGSHALKKALNRAFRRHADNWDIRSDQARILLMDRRAVA